jgi:cell division protein FtsQ
MSTSPLRMFWHDPALLDRVSTLLITASALAMIVLIGWWMVNRPVFAVKRVMVDTLHSPLQHVTPQQIQSTVGEAISGTVLRTDLAAIHAAAQSLPWVRSATVRRVWPNRLLVRIEEQQAIAVWDDKRLVNQQGEVFLGSPKEHKADCRLIILSGPEGSERLVANRAQELARWLAPLGAPLQSVTLSDQYAWTVSLQGGLELELGRDTLPSPLEERVRMFVKSQPWLARQLGAQGVAPSLTRADLRYATGYAYRTAPNAAYLFADPQAQTQPTCIGAAA